MKTKILVTLNIFLMMFVLVILLPIQTLNEYEPEVNVLERISDDDLNCLIQNAYYEARSDGKLSQIGVTHVVLNRAYHKSYPSKICDVVYQKTRNQRKQVTVCQFSWYCDRKLLARKIDVDSWERAETAVKKALVLYYNKAIDVTEGSTFYHAYYVKPGWNHLKRTTVIGSHIYYREKNNGTT